MIRRYRVHGRVQGVGFRHFVWRKAQDLELDGWVRNRRDGTVESLVRAGAADHERFLAFLELGPRWSRVDRVVCVEDAEPEALAAGFEVRGTM